MGPQYTRDHISAGTVDGTRAISDSFFTAFDFGLRFSDRMKSHHQYDYVVPTLGNNIPVDDLSQFQVKGFNVPEMLYGKWNTIAPLVYAPGSAQPGAPGLIATAGTSAANNFDNLPAHWHVKETTNEGYLKTDFAHDFGSVPMTGSLGVRIDDVNTTSTGFASSDGGATFNPVEVHNHYTDVLPSLNMIFNVADDQMVRFGAAKATSRPPLDALATGYFLNNPLPPTPPTGSGGNPTLKPFRADQVDLSYEWYFHEESLFAVAAYYKHLDTFIGQAQSQQTIGGVSYTITSPANGKGGDLEGVELTFQTRFFFLPGFFQDFGTYFNYSLVSSDVKEFTPAVNPLPMGGLAHNSGELDLFYNRDGFEMRAAYKFHARFTEIPGWTSSQLYQLDPEQTLDISASYQWTENIGLRLQASNITNEVSRASTDNDINDLARYDIFGRSYLLDIAYKY